MHLFSSKPKMQLEEFCQGFYDNYILHPKCGGIEFGKDMYEAFYNSIVEVEPHFNTVEITFYNQIYPLRFEIFQLAFLHEFNMQKSIALSVFTRQYLINNARSDLWEEQQFYNQAIAKSCYLNHTAETGVGRAHITYLNLMHKEIFDSWSKKGGCDLDCVARAVNRLGSDVAWKKHITLNHLMLAFCRKLGYEINGELKLVNQQNIELRDDAQFRIRAMIYGFYQGSRGAVNNIKLQ